MNKYINIDDIVGEIIKKIGVIDMLVLKDKAKSIHELDDISLVCDENKIQEIIKTEEIKNKKYAGLTVKELQQLSKLKFVSCIDNTVYGHCKFVNKVPDMRDIKKILPDPKEHYRAHIGNEQLIPNSMVIEMIDDEGNSVSMLAGDIDWGNFSKSLRGLNCVVGYRIIGVQGLCV